MTERSQAGGDQAVRAYQLSVSHRMTLEGALRAAPALVFGGLRRQAALEALHEPLVAVAATHAGSVVGLALAEQPPDGAAQLRSLVVAPEHRRRGLGTALVARTERALADAGCASVDCVYRGSWPTAPVIERLLRRRSWLPPETRMVHYRIDAPQMRLDQWPGQALERPGFRVAPWTALPAAERERMQQRQAIRPWFPHALSPFQLEERMDAATSVGLWHADQLVGWLITHRLAPDTLQYTSLFVAPPFQRYGGAFALIRSVAERQLAAGVPRAIFQVQAGNRAMVRFADRCLGPFLSARTESRASGKRLRPT